MTQNQNALDQAALAAHPLIAKAKRLAKELKKNLALEAKPVKIGLMRAQEIAAKQLGFASLYDLVQHCKGEIQKTLAQEGHLAFASILPPSVLMLGKSNSGLSVGLQLDSLRSVAILGRQNDQPSPAEILAIQAIDQGLGVTWIECSGNIKAAARLAHAARAAGRGSDVAHINMMTLGASGDDVSLSEHSAMLSPVLEISSGMIVEHFWRAYELGSGPAIGGRAASLLATVAMAAKHLSEPLTLTKLLSCFELEWLASALGEASHPPHIHQAITAYLWSLTDKLVAKGSEAPRISEKMLTRHQEIAAAASRQILNLIVHGKHIFHDGASSLKMSELASCSSKKIILATLPDSDFGSELAGFPVFLARAIQTTVVDHVGEKLDADGRPFDKKAKTQRRAVFFREAQLPENFDRAQKFSEAAGLLFFFEYKSYASLIRLSSLRSAETIVSEASCRIATHEEAQGEAHKMFASEFGREGEIMPQALLVATASQSAWVKTMP